MKARPIPKKRPVPMVPPSAMNWMCRDLRLMGCQELSQAIGKEWYSPSRNISVFLSLLDIAIHVGGLIDL